MELNLGEEIKILMIESHINFLCRHYVLWHFKNRHDDEEKNRKEGVFIICIILF